jgi:hypothetical protein
VACEVGEFSGSYSELSSNSNVARSIAVDGSNSSISGLGSSKDDTQQVCVRVESNSVSFKEMILGGLVTLQLKLHLL